jgi:anti-sigma B factor antagonist
MVTLKRLDVSEVGDVTVVHFRDQTIIDDLGIQETGQELFQLVDKDGRRKLLLNFASVGFMTSEALGKLITLNKKVKGQGGVVKMCNIRPEIHQVFTVTRLDRLFDIQKDESEALASF